MIYQDRNVEALDAAGGHYARHVQAMTDEGLHDKRAIAAELAWRDYQIARLKAEVARLTVYFREATW